jgi:protease I
MAKRVLFVVMPQQFQDHEFNIPYTMLTKKGYIVDIAGLTEGDAISTSGLKVTPSCILDKLTSKQFDDYAAMIIPGGPGSTKYLWNNVKLQESVRYFHAHKKIVACICYASIVPVQAGILIGKKATVYPTDEAKAILKKNGVEFIDQGIVTEENEKIITAQGPTFAKIFGQAIIDMLEK